MIDKDQDDLSRAYAEILATTAGKLVMRNLLEKLSVTVPVYAFGAKNDLADISYRDGQRNAGIYVYNQMALASPEVTAQLHADVMFKENERLRTVERGDDE